MMLIRTALVFFLAFGLIPSDSATGQPTETQYLSGTGNDDPVDWEFMVDGGRRAGDLHFHIGRE